MKTIEELKTDSENLEIQRQEILDQLEDVNRKIEVNINKIRDYSNLSFEERVKGYEGKFLKLHWNLGMSNIILAKEIRLKNGYFEIIGPSVEFFPDEYLPKNIVCRGEGFVVLWQEQLISEEPELTIEITTEEEFKKQASIDWDQLFKLK